MLRDSIVLEIYPSILDWQLQNLFKKSESSKSSYTTMYTLHQMLKENLIVTLFGLMRLLFSPNIELNRPYVNTTRVGYVPNYLYATVKLKLKDISTQPKHKKNSSGQDFYLL